MEELIAKRYIKAIRNASNEESMENVAAIFSALAESFKNDKFAQMIVSPIVSKSQKLEILLEAVKPANSKEVDNLIKLLIENNRLNIIPAIAEEMRKDLAVSNKTYTGIVYSNSDIDEKVLNDLSAGLSTKFDSKISLEYMKNDFDGIKVNVDDLGVEINFSKERINSQIIEHIVKAI